MIRKTLINPSGVEWTDYNANIYSGCAHDCAYCYARPKRPYIKTWAEWRSRWRCAVPVENAVELAQKEIRKREPGRIMFCSTCDAYQPLEKETELARQVLEVLLHSRHHVLICTKSDLVRRDYDVILPHKNVEVGFTFTSMDVIDEERFAPSPLARKYALRNANSLGIKTFVSIEPWIPEVTNPLEIIRELDPWVDRWIVGRLNHPYKIPAAYHSNVPDGYYRKRFQRVIEVLKETEKPFMIKRELAREVGYAPEPKNQAKTLEAQAQIR